MKRMNEKLCYGGGNGASLAARHRSAGHDYTAAVLESFYGERRTWDENGRTMHAVFEPEYYEFDRRCRDFVLYRAYRALPAAPESEVG